MNILNVVMSLDPITGGGTAERTFQMSRFLVRAGARTTILTLDIGLNAEHMNAMNEVRVVALPCVNRRFYLPRFSYRSIKKLVAEADIIHLMGHWTFINALVYFIVRNLHKPYVICPAGALPIYGRSARIKKIYNFIIGKKIIRNANVCIAVTKDEVDQFRAYGVVANKDIAIIPNGINAEDFKSSESDEFRKKCGLNRAPFILFMGRLNPIKGPDLLLKAFCNLKNSFKDYHLVFAGPDGGILAELKDKAAASGINERIHFVGYVDAAMKSQAYHAAALLVIPSRQEAMSIVVLEAGITRTPVLITDQCGFNEISQINGGLVVTASAEGLQQGLCNLLSAPEKLPLMGSNLYDYTQAKFAWESIVTKYLSLYATILQNEQSEPKKDPC